MSGRTLSDTEIQDAIRRPSFELQQAAIVAGYANVRDFVLSEAVEEIRMLKARVDALEGNAAVLEQSEACGVWDERMTGVCVLVPGHSDPHSFKRVNG